VDEHGRDAPHVLGETNSAVSATSL
jgi:hypothetical protein